jgi:ribose transport system substrate-binding protein
MRKFFAGTAAGLLALSMAACSSGPEATNSDGGAVDVSKYQTAAEQAMNPTSDWKGPATGPAAKADAKVMFIACGFAAEGCKGPADAATEAGAAIGWDVTVVDGKFDPQIYSRSISQAIDQKYDAIILNAISADAVAEPLKAARAAGIVVGSWDGANKPSDTGVSFEVDEPLEQQGINMANYMIWKTEGKANVSLLNAPEFNVVNTWVTAAKETFKECSTCTIAKDDQFVSSDAATRIPTLISSNLRQNPNINVVIGGYDAALISAIPTLTPTPEKPVLIGGFNGISAMLQFIRDGKASATSAVAIKWGTWAAFDNVNRLLQDQPIVEQKIPTRLITTENVEDITPGSQWDGDADYKTTFKTIWAGK